MKVSKTRYIPVYCTLESTCIYPGCLLQWFTLCIHTFILGGLAYAGAALTAYPVENGCPTGTSLGQVPVPVPGET